jgi:hypothetical protein
MVSAGYQTQSRDCSVEADLQRFALLRLRSPAERRRMAERLTAQARHLSLQGQRHQHPDLTGAAWGRHIAQLWTGRAFVPQGDDMSWQAPKGFASKLHPLFQTAGIEYFVTGGVASTVWGEPRMTQDVDLVLSLAPDLFDDLVTLLKEQGYLVAGQEQRGRMPLQVTDPETIENADLNFSDGSPWDRERMKRRIELEGIWYCTPEDLILAKLRWGKGSDSERQLRDVLGVLKTSAVDQDYLQRWANHLGLLEILNMATTQAQ